MPNLLGATLAIRVKSLGSSGELDDSMSDPIRIHAPIGALLDTLELSGETSANPVCVLLAMEATSKDLNQQVNKALGRGLIDFASCSTNSITTPPLQIYQHSPYPTPPRLTASYATSCQVIRFLNPFILTQCHARPTYHG